MAILLLDKVWINLVATGEGVAGHSVYGRDAGFVATGEVRTFAGGRRRSISQVGEAGTYSCTLRFMTQTQIETLQSWARRTVQVRDNLGRKFFGVYYDVNPKEIAKGLGAQYDVPIVVNVVTYTEGV